jgi:hypothetical protein
VNVFWWNRWGFSVALLCVLGAACADRPDEPLSGRSKESAAVDTPVVSARLEADSAALKKALAPGLSRSREGLRVVEMPSGSKRIPADGRFRSAHVATRGQDGKKRIDCVTTERELDAVLRREGRR